jgi:hypothetical protein
LPVTLDDRVFQDKNVVEKILLALSLSLNQSIHPLLLGKIAVTSSSSFVFGVLFLLGFNPSPPALRYCHLHVITPLAQDYDTEKSITFKVALRSHSEASLTFVSLYRYIVLFCTYRTSTPWKPDQDLKSLPIRLPSRLNLA